MKRAEGKDRFYRNLLGKVERERRAFLAMKRTLLQNESLKGKYVAIIDGQVVDSDTDDEELVARIYRRYGYRPMYIGLVTKTREQAFMPTPF